MADEEERLLRPSSEHGLPECVGHVDTLGVLCLHRSADIRYAVGAKSCGRLNRRSRNAETITSSSVMTVP